MSKKPPVAPFELKPQPTLALPTALSGVVPAGGPVAEALGSEARLPTPFHVTQVHPLCPEVAYVVIWFELMRAVAGERDGLTARQVARAQGAESHVSRFEAVLAHLASVGDLVASQGRTPRYRAQPLDKRLAWHLRQALGARPTGTAWAAFDHATLTHAVEGKQHTWHALREAFVTLVAGLPGWPEPVIESARLRAERWLPRIVEVTPPVHLREEDELVTLRERVRALEAENAALLESLAAAIERPVSLDGGKKAALKRQAEALQEANADLAAQVDELTLEVDALEAELEPFVTPDDGSLAAAFLAGDGPGPFPEALPIPERERLRALVQATRAQPEWQRALVAKLGAVYRRPLAYTRLTSRAFADAAHPFDTLHRARVGSYRLGYGVARGVPTVLHIGLRGDFYGTFLGRLAALGGGAL